MKKQSSSLIAKLLNKNSQPVPSVQDAGRIVMRDAREILPNPKNGSYSMDSIEELAAMIQLTHNIEPVAVKELPDGTFMLTSGHRRRLAQIYRFEQGMVDVPLLPTITQETVNEFSDVITDDEMETLNVVFPNKGQRRHLSPSEEAAEIELIRPILYKIYEHEKAAGNIQGKFRTFFAEVLQVSEATLHRKEAVGKVSEEIKAGVDAGNIKPTAAAALAGVDKEQQNVIVQSIKDRGEEITVDAVNRAKREMTKAKVDSDASPLSVEEKPIIAEDVLTSDSGSSSSAPDTQASAEETFPICEAVAKSNVSRIEASYWVRQKVVQYLDEMKDALKSAQSGDDEQEIEAWRARVQIVRDILGFLDGMEVKA